MLADRRTGLVGLLRQMHRVRIMIEGVQVLYDFAPLQVARDDVGRVNRIGCPGLRSRVVGTVPVPAARMGQSVARQDPLDRGWRGQRLDPESFQFAVDRPMAN